MKCPMRYKITQFNIRNSITNNFDEYQGESNLFIENQRFAECYKEECAAWDKEKKICRKV